MSEPDRETGELVVAEASLPTLPEMNNPLASVPGETTRALEALHVYVSLGPSRTLAETARTLGHSNKVTVEGWSRQWGWQDRLQKHIVAQGQAASLKLVEQRASAIDATVDDLNEIQSEAMSAWRRECEKPKGRRDIAPLRAALHAVAQRRKLLALDLPPGIAAPESPEEAARKHAERTKSDLAVAFAAAADLVGDPSIIDAIEALILQSMEPKPSRSGDQHVITGEISDADNRDEVGESTH